MSSTTCHTVLTSPLASLAAACTTHTATRTANKATHTQHAAHIVSMSSCQESFVRWWSHDRTCRSVTHCNTLQAVTSRCHQQFIPLPPEHTATLPQHTPGMLKQLTRIHNSVSTSTPTCAAACPRDRLSSGSCSRLFSATLSPAAPLTRHTAGPWGLAGSWVAGRMYSPR